MTKLFWFVWQCFVIVTNALCLLCQLMTWCLVKHAHWLQGLMYIVSFCSDTQIQTMREQVLHHTFYNFYDSRTIQRIQSMHASWYYNDVIMGMMASQITSLTIVYSTVYSSADQRKHQSSASLAFVRGIHRGPVNSLHKWPVTRKMFPFDDVIMEQ